jgi:PHD/YefM family antitoxin component YafN of YafNO toxin-antitoxin module
MQNTYIPISKISSNIGVIQKSLEDNKPVYLLKNSKPISVIITVDEYEYLQNVLELNKRKEIKESFDKLRNRMQKDEVAKKWLKKTFNKNIKDVTEDEFLDLMYLADEIDAQNK